MSETVSCRPCLGKGFIERETREYCEHEAYVCRYCLGERRVKREDIFKVKVFKFSGEAEDRLIEKLREKNNAK